MAGPRPLSRAELERVHWTVRPIGCGPQAQHVQVAEVVQRVLRGGGRAAAVSTRIPGGLPVVKGDARRLETALAGLVDHAVRRNPAGAAVLVRAEVAAVGRAGPRRARGAEDVGGPEEAGALDPASGWGGGPARVEIRVVDRGPCELPEAREWLLAGMRTGGPAGPAVHGLVRAAGGRLAVEQTPGGGLTVVLALAVALE
ncbi:hypothetical protein [Kitasatospora sp. NPDC090091]|uniref:hypothetical protein n=1 Tax=Kitasatospora sp. NPDC090091 TaxID=3364081 RepID=UPI0037F3B44D